MTTHIERLQTQVALAAQEAALLDAQAHVAGQLAAAAYARFVGLRSDLEAALRSQGLAVLRDGWQNQTIDLRALEKMLIISYNWRRMR